MYLIIMSNAQAGEWQIVEYPTLHCIKKSNEINPPFDAFVAILTHPNNIICKLKYSREGLICP